MSMKMIEQGHNPDPITGGCQDCGARREEIDDNLVPTCEKITGPHKTAIIVLRREQRRVAWAAREIAWAARENRQQARLAERAAAQLSEEARECEQDERELAASIQLLKG